MLIPRNQEEYQKVITGKKGGGYTKRRTNKHFNISINKNALAMYPKIVESTIIPPIKANEKNIYNRHTGSGLDILLKDKKLTQKGLLSADEEKQYGKLVQQLMNIQGMQQYILNREGRQPTSAELAAVFKMDERFFVQFRETCEEARRRMTECNLRLVISIAKKIHQKKRTLSLHELVAVGNDGLTRAVEKFDPSKGYKFSTYSHWWIRQAIDRFILEQRNIKVPIHLWEIFAKICKAQRALRDKLNREPTYSEIGALLGLNPDRVEHIIQAYRNSESLNMTTDGLSKAGSLEETIVLDEDELFGSDQLRDLELSDARVKEKMETLLKAVLTRREAEILRMRYGIDDGIPKTLDEIGEQFRVTRDHVRQIEIKAGRKLKLCRQREILQKDIGSLFEMAPTKGSNPKASGMRKSD